MRTKLQNKVTIFVAIILLVALTACSGAAKNKLNAYRATGSAESTDTANSEYEAASDVISAADMSEEAELEESADSGMLMPMKSPDAVDEEFSDSEGSDAENPSVTEPSTDEIPGQVLEGGKGMVPRGWPADVTIPLGFDVRYGAADQSGIKLVIFGYESAEMVREFYEELEGWNVIDIAEPQIDVDDTSEVVRRIVMTLDQRPNMLSIDVIEKEPETLVQLHFTAG